MGYEEDKKDNEYYQWLMSNNGEAPKDNDNGDDMPGWAKVIVGIVIAIVILSSL
ncbi:MAG: hypothetical protein WCL18_02125 [bacterium]